MLNPVSRKDRSLCVSLSTSTVASSRMQVGVKINVVQIRLNPQRREIHPSTLSSSITFVSLCLRSPFYFSPLSPALRSLFSLVLSAIVFASLRSHVVPRPRAVAKGMAIATMVVDAVACYRWRDQHSRSSVWIWTNIRTIVFGSLLPGSMGGDKPGFSR